MDDLERRLRQSLLARADDVAPTPRLWEEVRDRHTRRRRFRRVLAVATVAVALVTAAAVPVALGALRDRGVPDVAVDPTPTATPTGSTDQPEPSPTPTPPAAVEEPEAPVASDALLVTTDGNRVELRTADGEVLETLFDIRAAYGEDAEIGFAGVAVRPGSTRDHVVAVVLVRGEGLRELRWLDWRSDRVSLQPFPAGLDISPDARADVDGVVPHPVWSPDGRHLAWLEQSDGGTVRLRTVGWTDGEGPGTGRTADDNASWDVGTAEEYGVGARLQDWVWNERSGEEAVGVLNATAPFAPDAEETGSVISYEVARQADGALALLVWEGAGPGTGSVLDLDPPYLLEVVRGGEGTVDLRLSADGAELALPDELERTSDVSGIWLEAAGGTVVVGNGARAWVVSEDGVRPLTGAVHAAGLVT